jgi:hypothetical protein
MSTYRVEIIGNRSIQDDLEDLLKGEGAGLYRTVFPEAQGTGRSGPRRGDHVWPEENFVMVVYCGLDEARKLKDIVGVLQERFDTEGITCFVTQGADLG